MIRSVSKRQARMNRQYMKLRKEYLEANPVCEVETCCRNATELHHRRGRGSNLLAVEYFMSCCFEHHTKIELNRAWAYEMGYLLDRLGKI
jgi:hypothetical protein